MRETLCDCAAHECSAVIFQPACPSASQLQKRVRRMRDLLTPLKRLQDQQRTAVAVAANDGAAGPQNVRVREEIHVGATHSRLAENTVFHIPAAHHAFVGAGVDLIRIKKVRGSGRHAQQNHRTCFTFVGSTWMALMGRMCGRKSATHAFSSALSRSSTPKLPRLSPVLGANG